jgi:hypothetical protein
VGIVFGGLFSFISDRRLRIFWFIALQKYNSQITNLKSKPLSGCRRYTEQIITIADSKMWIADLFGSLQSETSQI